MLTLAVWGIIALLTVVTVIVRFTPPDVDPYFVGHQASFSHSRRKHESAVVRSSVNPHGRVLLGQNTLQKFRLAAIFDQTSAKIATFDGLNIEVPNNLAQTVSQWRAALGSTPKGPVLIALPESINTLALLFACEFGGHTPYFTSPLESQEVLDAANAINAVAVVVPKALASLGFNATVLTEPGSATESSEPVADNSETALGVVVDGKVYTYSHSEVGRAVAAQLSVLGEQEKWTNADTVLVFGSEVSPFSLLLQLTALSVSAKLVFVEHNFMDPFKTVQAVRATIIITDDLTVRSLVRTTDDFGLGGWLQLVFRSIIQNRGVLMRGVLPQFKSVRLIYSNAILDDRRGSLTPSETRYARSLAGAQLIHALMIPESFLVLAQTTYGDYRSRNNEKLQFGPPAPGVELKVESSESNPNQGQGLYRTDEKNWKKVNAELIIGKDGCIYKLAPPPEKEVPYWVEHSNE